MDFLIHPKIFFHKYGFPKAKNSFDLQQITYEPVL